MSEKSKGRIQTALSVVAIILSIGAAGVTAGMYMERTDQFESRLDRIDRRVNAIYEHVIGDERLESDE